jgi:predicted nucleic acid-binding protein
MLAPLYCLDANVLIQAWQKYYSPVICPDYWDRLNELGEEGVIFIPESVYEEIIRTEDDLASWLKNSKVPVRQINGQVTQSLQTIYKANPIHKNLVDNVRGRSLADPWVIAHAMNEKAIVVTKEEKITAANSTKIKIPNVCDNMGIRWINDFDFVAEVGMRFSCSFK